MEAGREAKNKWHTLENSNVIMWSLIWIEKTESGPIWPTRESHLPMWCDVDAKDKHATVAFIHTAATQRENVSMLSSQCLLASRYF